MRVLLVLGLLVQGLLAQGPLVVPGSHAAREGTSSSNVPFGRGTPTRVQCVYDGMLFSGPLTISGLALRPDGGSSATGKVVDVEIRMSTMPHPLVQLDAAFAPNRGLDEVIVLPQQLVTLPAFTAATTPSAFLAPIALATPFVYDPQQGPLVIEFTVFGQPPGTFPLDTTYVCDSPMVPFGPLACPQPGSGPLRVESSTTQVMWGRPWVARVLDGQPNAWVALALGTMEGGSWGGVTLPHDLAPYGGAGCFLSTDLAAMLIGLTDQNGSATFTTAIPNVPAALGFWIRFQAGCHHPTANALQIVTSQAQKVQVCGWEPVGRVWASGLSATVGAREIGVAPVLQLH